MIWGYHWLQVGLYEPLVTGQNADERQAGILATVARFRQMIENAPENMPRLMPMTAAIAPVFSARYPEAAIIFDNLHGMHDVISDILASPKVPRDKKRQEILTAASRYRDSTSFVMTRKEWSEMATMMGVANMGGPAVGFTPEFPTPTVRRGATADEAMKGMHGGSAGASDTSAVDHSQDGSFPADAGHRRARPRAPSAGTRERLHGDTDAPGEEARAADGSQQHARDEDALTHTAAFVSLAQQRLSPRRDMRRRPSIILTRGTVAHGF